MRKILAALTSAALFAALLASPASAAPATITDPSGRKHLLSSTKLLDSAGSAKTAAVARPKPVHRPGQPSTKLALTYFYNIVYQYTNATPGNTPTGCTGNVGSEGFYADESVHNVYVDNAAGDFHSLQQIWALSCDLQQGVEVGWANNLGVFGDNKPRLFVYARKNGAGFGWNQKFTQLTGAGIPQAGMDLSAAAGTGAKRFAAQYFSSKWWVSYDNVWFGYFDPNTAGLWNTAPTVAFTKSGHVQAGGEVAANSSAPCTDMGLGVPGRTLTTPWVINSSAASSWNSQLLVPPAGVTVNMNYENPTNANYYRHMLNPGSVRSIKLGGGGAC